MDVFLKKTQITRVRSLAFQIGKQIRPLIKNYSTLSVERTILRLYGVDGLSQTKIPLPNRIVDLFKAYKLLSQGVSKPFAAAMVCSQKDPQITAQLLDSGQIEASHIKKISEAVVEKKEAELAHQAIDRLDATKNRKHAKIKDCPLPQTPWRYIIVATGNIHEDVIQAESAVIAGADIIAVIRSTAQSLLDYVPYGATTEGFGGTYATQKNFQIMRQALDAASKKAGRYVRLVNYSSGLCMAEIAACAAIEDLDMLLNDSMYGILFRDINMRRTFIDQYFSRLICARAGIIINTGEDNYLTTTDAIENAHTVTASQLINEAMAKEACLTDDLLGLGHAFEIDPEIPDSLNYEIAHALLARHLFPKAPLKYMPPTKFKSGDIFYSHCLDSFFNFVSILTDQHIHLGGMLTEALHTPLMQDRFQALKNINYVFNSARSLKDEFQLNPQGNIAKRIQQVLDETETFLKEIKNRGLMKSIEDGRFADISRSPQGGRGLDGVFKKRKNYSNPIADLLYKQGA